MTFKHIEDIFDANAEAVINPVNCEGAMGKGLALRFKANYPEMFKAYQYQCLKGLLKIGTVYTFTRPHGSTPRHIICFPSKDKWRNASEYSYIDKGLEALTDEIHRLNLKSIAIPKIGCGLGALRWEIVYKKIQDASSNWPNGLIVYLPDSVV